MRLFKQKGIEVLLLTDRIDEWLVGHLNKYKEKDLTSVAKAGLDLGKLADQKEEQPENNEETSKPILEKIKSNLGDKVKDVQITNRLVNSPSCLVVDNNAMSIHLERLLKQAGQATPDNKPILEINLNHDLLEKLDTSIDESQIKDLSFIIFEQAMLAEGLQLDDPSSFVQRVNRLIV